MSLITRVRKQYAVYWPKTGINDRGKATYGTAVEIRCRWDDVNEAFLSPTGREEVSNSKVMVDRVVVLGGMLRYGRLADVTNLTEPAKNSGTYEIRQVQNTPNLKATETLRIAIL